MLIGWGSFFGGIEGKPRLAVGHWLHSSSIPSPAKLYIVHQATTESPGDVVACQPMTTSSDAPGPMCAKGFGSRIDHAAADEATDEKVYGQSLIRHRAPLAAGAAATDDARRMREKNNGEDSFKKDTDRWATATPHQDDA